MRDKRQKDSEHPEWPFTGRSGARVGGKKDRILEDENEKKSNRREGKV